MRIDDLLKIGVGSLFIAKEKMEEFIEKAKEKGELTENEAKKLLEDLKKESEEKLEKLRLLIKEEIKNQIKELGIVTKEDLESLKREILEELNAKK